MLKLEFYHLAVFLRRIESTVWDFGDEMRKVGLHILPSGHLGLLFLWRLVHFMVSIWYFLWSLITALESFLISSGLLEKYKVIDISKVRYLAVVIDSEEAGQTTKVLTLLSWLKAIGIKKVCLYDSEGVLKRSKEALAMWLNSKKISKEMQAEHLIEKDVTLEVISLSDGKHAVAKAANFLLDKHYLNDHKEIPVLTESDMTAALEALGFGGTEPDLMLIYGPARCHQGFPPWRIRYAEMVYMGPLKSMKFGALIKAIHRFTRVQQNYGK